MQIKIKYEEIMREVDARIAAIDLNGRNIIEECKAVLPFLKDKLSELKQGVLLEPFGEETEEITFFKYQKPLLLGRLMFFYKVLHIESNCPPCAELADDYYRKQQEEQNCFSMEWSASTSTTVAAQPIVIVTTSCERKKR